MKHLLVLIAFASALSAAADKQDIALADGRTLKAARIVAIGQETVAITHAAGAATVATDVVPLDILARAHMELEKTEADRKKKAAEIAAKADERTAAAQAKRDEEIRIRLAMANAREQAQGGEAVAMPRRSAAALDKAIAELKASTPKHSAATSPDPMIRDCVSKYTRAFSHIRHDTITQSAKMIRSQLQNDLASYEQTLATTIKPRAGQKTATSSMRAAAESNHHWLKQLSQHVQRFEDLVR